MPNLLQNLFLNLGSTPQKKNTHFFQKQQVFLGKLLLFALIFQNPLLAQNKRPVETKARQEAPSPKIRQSSPYPAQVKPTPYSIGPDSGTNVITFDEYPVGTTIADQYADKGILFSPHLLIHDDKRNFPAIIDEGNPSPGLSPCEEDLVSHLSCYARGLDIFSSYFVEEVYYIKMWVEGSSGFIWWFDGPGNVLGHRSLASLDELLEDDGVTIIPDTPDTKEPYGSTITIEQTGVRSWDLINSSFIDNVVVKFPLINSVQFEAINSPLDNNPNAGGGQRMFPEKSKGLDKTTVRVKVDLQLPRKGKVYLEVFDMDDPSTDEAPVDSNGANGGDNNGTTQGTLSSTVLDPEKDGDVSQVTFTLTKQPGDNFRVVASTSQSELSGIVVDGTKLMRYGKEITDDATPAETKSTPMLTVWRKLHIEVDSMGVVSGNQVQGTITGQVEAGGEVTLTTDITQPLEINRFEFGKLYLLRNGREVGSASVVRNGTNTVIIRGAESGSVPSLVGLQFRLVDDDNVGNFNSPNGDSGVNVPAPNLSLMQTSDSASVNVFAPAYVVPTYDWGTTGNDIPFVLNSPATLDGQRSIYRFDQAATKADPDFWTVYLLGCYQISDSNEFSDGDPNELAPGLGIDIAGGLADGVLNGVPGDGACVFTDTLRESVSPNSAVTAAHEVGHLLGGEHIDDGLMAQDISRNSFVFTGKTLDKIRRTIAP
ncbi:hypothetical protein [Candidatus Cyanaurora vandensis]|uniref:hypothetical protein n=1 Tax=Candidatus Cyanaurora vandensis TaxID=2714958 RepID=UPI002579CBB1|nr:hypothetical protein [Candidatus Cyanaurora vandensis]